MLDDRPVWVTIPTIGYSELLVPLINQIQEEVDKIVLTVNLEEFVEPVEEFFRFGEPCIEVVETWPLGKSLYHGWNTAIEMARHENAWLAVLNDDIRLTSHGAIEHVTRLLADNPSYAIVGLNWQGSPESTDPGARPLRQVHGSYRHYGVGGFAWVCDPHKVALVPDDFVWWFGDDHIFFSAERDGHKVGIATHAHVEHVNELTANSGTQDWTHVAKVTDTIAFSRIWPGK